MNHPIQPNPTPPVAVDPAPRLSATPQPHPASKRQRRDDSNQQYVQIRAGIFRNVSITKCSELNLHNLKSSLSMFKVDSSNTSTDSSSVSFCPIAVSPALSVFLISQCHASSSSPSPSCCLSFFSFFILFLIPSSRMAQKKNANSKLTCSA